PQNSLGSPQLPPPDEARLGPSASPASRRHLTDSTRSTFPVASPKFHSNFGVLTVSGPSSTVISASAAGAAARQRASADSRTIGREFRRTLAGTAPNLSPR